METMQTIPGLLAVAGLIPTASAKPSQRSDVSESRYGVLESSEMHPVKSMMTFPVLGGYTTMDRPHTYSVRRRSGSRTLQLLEYNSLYLGTEPRRNEGDFSWCESQLHVCLATQVFINILSTALRSLLFFFPMWELGPPLGPLTHCGQESCGNAEAISHWALRATFQVLLLTTEHWERWLPSVLQQGRQQASAHLSKQSPSV